MAGHTFDKLCTNFRDLWEGEELLASMNLLVLFDPVAGHNSETVQRIKNAPDNFLS